LLEENLRELLKAVKKGEISIEEAYQRLKRLAFVDLGFAKVDHHRKIRTGFSEVIFCHNKSRDQVKAVAIELLKYSETLLATKADVSAYEAIKEIASDAKYYSESKLVVVDRRKKKEKRGFALVISAGTSDLPIAEEAAITADLMGARVERLYDVGVAGVHRLLSHAELFEKAQVVVVVAGMDGVLPSLVGGLVSCPVIAVPTSVGYGASFNGLAALLTMLNSCASGVAVVNIDNGFGAGYIAALICQEIAGEAG
jgi:hypothetical protein